MAELVDKDTGQGTTDVKEYNRYCHFIAGLVGEGLSRLVLQGLSGLENPEQATSGHLSDQMGLFFAKSQHHPGLSRRLCGRTCLVATDYLEKVQQIW